MNHVGLVKMKRRNREIVMFGIRSEMGKLYKWLNQLAILCSHFRTESVTCKLWFAVPLSCPRVDLIICPP